MNWVGGEVTHFSTKVQNCLWKVHLRVPGGQPLPESPSEQPGVHCGSSPQDGRIGLRQPLPSRGKSKQLRLYRGMEEEGAYPVGQGPGTQAGDIQVAAQEPQGMSTPGRRKALARVLLSLADAPQKGSRGVPTR